MKIALIGQSFDENSGQGVYEYSGQLYKNLKRLNKDIEKIEIGIPKNPLKTLFNNIFISLFKTLKTKSDIYHFMMPEVSFPVLFKRPSIVTIHDVIPLIIANERKRIFNFYFRFIMNIALKANQVIVDSESTKSDILKFYKINSEKIFVIPLGIDHDKFYPLKNKKKNIIFTAGYMGGLGKRKNVEFILKLAKEFEKDKKITFKIAGRGPELERLIKIKEKLNLRNVEFVGFIPEEKLNKFYNSLDLFIFPSLYEGFGFPPLEAIACGVPVIVSNRSSLPEIIRNGGILINPENLENSINETKRVIKDKKLRKELIKRGVKRSRKFNWDKTTEKTAEIYEKCLNN